MQLSLAPILSAETRLEIRMELQVPNGLTLTVFPMSERWLREDSDRQWAVQRIPAKCKPKNFWSLMDYLYAAVFPDRYWQVMNYYADKGPPLRKIATRDQRMILDGVLIEALKQGYKDHCEDRERSWSRVRRITDKRYFRSVG